MKRENVPEQLPDRQDDSDDLEVFLAAGVDPMTAIVAAESESERNSPEGSEGSEQSGRLPGWLWLLGGVVSLLLLLLGLLHR